MSERPIVIAGGGLAGQRCCETLRRMGWDGGIQLVCAEGTPPYDRPPLSKRVLHDPPTVPPTLRARTWHADNGVELLLGVRAHRLDARARVLHLGDGRALPYRSLLAATGAAPLVPPVLRERENVHVLRDFGHAVELGTALRAGARLAVVGAGFLGLEVAAAARSIGAAVSVVDIAPLPLARVLPDEVGRWFADLHASEGVELHLGDGVAAVRGGARHVDALVLASGAVVACDVVLAATGVRPATKWLADYLEPGHALPAGQDGSTAIPDVFAAGDVTGSQQWEVAARQGVVASQSMLGVPASPLGGPSFWTDHYGTRIQFVGSHEKADRATWDGSPAERDFALVWWRRDRPIGGLLAGRPRSLPALRRLIDHAECEKGGEHELQGVRG